jgi:hypothetical protein
MNDGHAKTTGKPKMNPAKFNHIINVLFKCGAKKTGNSRFRQE